MQYGLWRYWQHNKKECALIALMFALLMQCITMLASYTLRGMFASSFSADLVWIGSESKSGKLNRINLHLATEIAKIPALNELTPWYIDSVAVQGKSDNIAANIAFTTANYAQLVKPRYSRQPHPVRCELQACSLVGAAVSAQLLEQLDDKAFIRINNESIPITTVFEQPSLKFPKEEAHIVVDVAQFAHISSMASTINMIMGVSPGATKQAIAGYFPIYHVVAQRQKSVSEASLQEALTNTFEQYTQSHTSQLATNMSLQGSSGKDISYIEGPYTDRLTKKRDSLMLFLFALSALLLVFVTAALLISITSRHSIRRTSERAIRTALGSNKAQLFFNECAFMQLPLLLGTGLGLTLLYPIASGFSWLFALISDLKPASIQTQLGLFAALSVGITILLPSLLNFPLLVRYINGRSTHLSRQTILKTRILTSTLFLLTCTAAFFTINVTMSWYKLSHSASKNLDLDSQIITLWKENSESMGSGWSSVFSGLRSQWPDISLIETPALDKRLTFTPLQAEDESCNITFDSWKNRFYQQSLSTLLLGEVNSTLWDDNHIAISHSMLAPCDWSEQQAIGKFFKDKEGNRYKVHSIIKDVRYDPHLEDMPYVYYQQVQQASDLHTLVIPKHITLNTVEMALKEQIAENNLPLEITFSGSLRGYLNKQLKQDRAMLNITLALMLLSLAALVWGLQQHLSKVITMRNTEWGTRRALGATKARLVKLIASEFLHDLVIACAAATIITFLCRNLLSVHLAISTWQLWLSLALAACAVAILSQVLISARAVMMLNASPASQLKEKS